MSGRHTCAHMDNLAWHALTIQRLFTFAAADAVQTKDAHLHSTAWISKCTITYDELVEPRVHLKVVSMESLAGFECWKLAVSLARKLPRSTHSNLWAGRDRAGGSDRNGSNRIMWRAGSNRTRLDWIRSEMVGHLVRSLLAECQAPSTLAAYVLRDPVAGLRTLQKQRRQIRDK